jgi:hypothetical protein
LTSGCSRVERLYVQVGEFRDHPTNSGVFPKEHRECSRNPFLQVAARLSCSFVPRDVPTAGLRAWRFRMRPSLPFCGPSATGAQSAIVTGLHHATHRVRRGGVPVTAARQSLAIANAPFTAALTDCTTCRRPIEIRHAVVL